jgi:hypothetical protein
MILSGLSIESHQEFATMDEVTSNYTGERISQQGIVQAMEEKKDR